MNRHLQLTIPTAKGHMRKQHQNYRSTKPKPTHDKDAIDMTAHQARQYDIYIKPIEATGLICTDQTRGFPITSS